jgi:hypothetical protein
MRSIVGSSIAALAVWLVAHIVVGADLAVQTGGTVQPIGWISVVVASLVAAVAGWTLFLLLDRYVTRGRLVWTVVASIVFLISLGGPLSGVDTASILWLGLIHLSVALVLIFGLRRSDARRPPTDATP